MTLNVEFKKTYPDLDPDAAIVGEDGPHPFLGGELTEVWFENNDEYDTCFYLQHAQLGNRVVGDFEALCSFANQQLVVK
ncbi:MAG: hypothetical protein ABL973_16715 [Micropepsaceae bacterium]